MHILSKYEVQAIAIETMSRWRPLERARYQYHMISPDPMPVLVALDAYQNEDGGFGRGIEPDFWLPASSPMATSVGLQYLSELIPTDEVVDRIEKALNYLTHTFDSIKMGWNPLPSSVNLYAHAPWWHHSEATGDELNQWGNPSIELIGYFLKWQRDSAEATFKEQLDFSEKYLLSLDPAKYEAHEIFCYLRTYPYLSPHRQARLYPVLGQAIDQLLNCNPDDWDKYVPKALDFVPHPRDERFNIKPECLTAQLDYEALRLSNHKIIEQIGRAHV